MSNFCRNYGNIHKHISGHTQKSEVSMGYVNSQTFSTSVS